MFIDEIFPDVVGAKAPLPDRLVAEALSGGFSNEYAEKLLRIVPRPLSDAECILDRLTGLWGYEFGLPYDIGRDFVWALTCGLRSHTVLRRFPALAQDLRMGG